MYAYVGHPPGCPLKHWDMAKKKETKAEKPKPMKFVELKPIYKG